MGHEKEITAQIIVGADGVESRVGRWAGIETNTEMIDMETCAQVTASNIDLSPDNIHLFSKEKKTAN